MQEMPCLNRNAPRYAPRESTLAIADYVHPREVIEDDRLAPLQKRAILSAWASDAYAVESRPGFRWLPGTPGPILIDHVLTALRSLDVGEGRHSVPGGHPTRDMGQRQRLPRTVGPNRPVRQTYR